MQVSFHLARAGTGQGANGVAGRRLLRAVRLAQEQDRGRLFLEEGKLELFKTNSVAGLLEPVRHVLRGTVITNGARGPVAAARGGNLLQRLQMAECALARREVGPAAGRRAADNVVGLGNAVNRSHQQGGSETDVQASPNR